MDEHIFPFGLLHIILLTDRNNTSFGQIALIYLIDSEQRLCIDVGKILRVLLNGLLLRTIENRSPHNIRTMFFQPLQCIWIIEKQAVRLVGFHL